MHYVSTRGDHAGCGFTDVLLAGLARDGGLYTPQRYPVLGHASIAALAGLPYAEAAHRVIAPFVGDDIEDATLRPMLDAAYASFRHPAVAPLAQIGDNLFVLELFHGPTLAFKDVAMQLLARLMDQALRARGQRATILGATSGDTGAAAIEAFRGLAQADVFILYPHGRVSDVQRRQMTTVAAPNIHTIAVEGTFDDCQAIVKSLFNQHRFRDEVGLSGVNSINWARIVAQVVYFFTSAVALGAPHRAVSFAVPTGNFGDVLAGYVAKLMGLPISRLHVATNANDILARCLATGAYEMHSVIPTSSPSMDIQISSNFERVLFDALGRDAAALRALMASLAQSRRFTLAPDVLARLRAYFDASATSETATKAEMTRTYKQSGYVLDPHTAVAVHAARAALARDPATPMIVPGTAHPAKFPDAVQAATGTRPQLPPHLADLMERREHFDVLANDAALVERFIRARASVRAPA